MNLVCRMVEYVLATSAVPVSLPDEPSSSAVPSCRQRASVQMTARVAPWMRRHLERCASCRSYQADTEALAHRLTEALDAPGPSDAFVERVWERIDAEGRTTKSYGRGTVALWAAATCAVFAVVVASKLRVSAPVTVQNTVPRTRLRTAGIAERQPDAAVGNAERTPQTHQTHARKDEGRRARSERRPTNDHERKATDAERAAIRRLPIVRRRMAHAPRATVMPSAQNPMPAPPGPTVAAAPSAQGWAYLGRYYESQSDPTSAAYAYRELWQDTGDIAAIFAVGRTSEEAGDILSAVECYADMLEAHTRASSSDDGISECPDRLRVRA